MANTTNVPTVTFSPTGFVEPAESAILAGVEQDINTAFGGNLNFGTTGGSLTNATPQGQLAASMAAIIGNVNDTFLFFSTQTDPAFAEGRMQDAIGRIYFIERNPPLPTTLQILCTGAVGTTIPVAALIVDPGTNIYQALVGGTIGPNGTVTLTFVAQVAGSLAVPNSVAIYQAISGWDTATLLSGVQGQAIESRAAFEARRSLSTAANSLGSLPSILGTVLSVPGVLQAFVFENTSNLSTIQGNVTIAPNSVYVAAFGGNPTAVATAIWSRKAPGCAYGGGNTTVQIQDTSPGYSPPFPTYNVTYQIPNPLPLLFAVNIVNSVQVPANASTLIQNAIINAAAGNPNAQGIVDGPVATIGSKIWASRFNPPIAALGNWASGNIISILIGSNNNPDAASAFAYCSGTTAFVTSMISGTISAGQFLSISNGSGVILANTNIVSQISGAAGGTGAYIIDTANSIGLANLLPNSNTFSSWSLVGGATVTGSSGLDPLLNLNDAWLLQRNGTASNIYITVGVLNGIGGGANAKPASNLLYTFSCYAHVAAGGAPFLALGISDNISSAVSVTFNVQTGAVSNNGGASGTFAAPTAVIQAAGGGWYRCIMSVLTGPLPTLGVVISCNSDNGQYTSPDTASSTMLIYGTQVEVGSIANPYIATGATPVINQIIGFATADQTSVQVHLDQIPTVAAGNIVVTYT